MPKFDLSNCRIDRGLGVMDMCEQPIFAMAFDAAVQRHTRRPLEPRLLRQLLQVHTHLACKVRLTAKG